MCYLFYHLCKYCNNQYECKEKNYICPTINRDEDELMCPQCREKERLDFIKLMQEMDGK